MASIGICVHLAGQVLVSLFGLSARALGEVLFLDAECALQRRWEYQS